ncbi:MAG: helix-turn-helix domain-containing protein [Pseudomonadota bacterium]
MHAIHKPSFEQAKANSFDIPFLTVADTAMHLGVSKSKIYRDIRRGKLAADRTLDRITLISPRALKAAYPDFEIRKVVDLDASPLLRPQGMLLNQGFATPEEMAVDGIANQQCERALENIPAVDEPENPPLEVGGTSEKDENRTTQASPLGEVSRSQDRQQSSETPAKSVNFSTINLIRTKFLSLLLPRLDSRKKYGNSTELAPMKESTNTSFPVSKEDESEINSDRIEMLEAELESLRLRIKILEARVMPVAAGNNVESESDDTEAATNVAHGMFSDSSEPGAQTREEQETAQGKVQQQVNHLGPSPAARTPVRKKRKIARRSRRKSKIKRRLFYSYGLLICGGALAVLGIMVANLLGIGFGDSVSLPLDPADGTPALIELDDKPDLEELRRAIENAQK